MLKKTLHQILPPFITTILRKIGYATGILKKKSKYIYKPSWYLIRGGHLKGREIFIDTHDENWQKELLDGTYDKFFFDYLKNLDLHSKTIFDIGAHIGYHAMIFAQLVGKSGLVFAFEPNKFNIKRMNLILAKNKDLADRIKIVDLAISDKIGEIEFNFSSAVDDGRSSGSYISGAHTPFKDAEYESVGFQKEKVKTVPLDQLSKVLKIKTYPVLIKIDVEGAENLVLNGAVETIKQYQPIIFIEIHSIFNMYHACNFFQKLDYNIEILNESKTDGRCFIVAHSKKGNQR